MKLNIGNVETKNNLILAPMAGVTDQPFRLLCKAEGCGLLYSEMVSAKAIIYNNKNTFELLKVEEKEHPIALQLFGSEPEIMAEAAKRLEGENFDFFDINMGCPVPKVVNNNEGSALMKNPKLAGEIVEAMVKAVNKPVTVKFRTGFTKDTINAVSFAKIMEASGASAVAVHGRTREQYYSGKADWDVIRQVKEAVGIPVIGNGDVNSVKSAKALLDETGCDGIMIGRGVRGNPWLFSQILHFLETGEEKEKPTIEEVKEMIIRHGKLQLKYKGEYTGIREMRKHIAWYTAGFPHSAALRSKVNSIETMDSIIELLEYFSV